jgi:hypothetical protein
MSEAIRYLCVARLCGQETFFFWESRADALGRVVLDEAGFVLAFPSELEARNAVSATHTVSTESPAFYDFDAVKAWCVSDNQSFDCSEMLNVWNMLTDVPLVRESLFLALDSRANTIYDKLFYSCSVLPTAPEGEHRIPDWNTSEINALKRLLLLGLSEFRARIANSRFKVS